MRIPFFSTTPKAEEPKVVEAPKATVPPSSPNRARTLVLCFDGTGDQEDDDNTNVVELRKLLKIENEEEQCIYYQTGIGTYRQKLPGVKEPVKIPIVAGISQKLDQATAWSLGEHVSVAYYWLVEHYRPGDKICMFGFSRGSYTARALAGMLFKVGLLPNEHIDQVQAAYKSYENSKDLEAWQASEAFHDTWGCRDVPIEFVGCWDTVNSVGTFTTKGLPFTAFNPLVKNFRHAIAMDERRAKFRTNLWSPSDQAIPGSPNFAMNDLQKFIHDMVTRKSVGLPATSVDEVWFAGCHCDVGGGSVKNETKPNLAHIPLRWMIRQCFLANTGMMFYKDDMKKKFHLDPDTLYPVVKKRPQAIAPKVNKVMAPKRQGPIDTAKSWGSWAWSYVPFIGGKKPEKEEEITINPDANEEEADAIDALAPIYDMLEIKPQMWLPFEKIGRLTPTWDPKLGKHAPKTYNKLPRNMRGPISIDQVKKVIVKAQVKVHRSVLARMNAQMPDGSFYVPKAVFSATKKPLTMDTPFTGEGAQFTWVD
ncbi:hypothetical protein CPC08DRAFT_666484 [Agrocybe pediades]|nr:hypothetical protein CPC08DRAFT_666484 [Agrocybe pediades]